MAKRFLLLTIILLLCAGMGYGEESFPFLGEINADNVNLRSGQSENFERLLQLKKGGEIVVLGRNYSWYKVRLPAEATLYVSSEYIRPIGGNLGVAKAGRLNIRSGKGIHFSVIGQLDEGEKVRIKERDKDWYGIEPPDKTVGWISDQYVSFKSQAVPELPRKAEEKIVIIEGPVPVEDKPPAEAPAAEEAPAAVVPEPEQPGPPKVSEPEEAVEKKAAAPEASAIPEEQTVAVTGRLEPAGKKDVASGFAYKLVTDDGKVYYLHAHKGVLDHFRNLKVKVHGKLKADPSNYFPHPVIIISKINLII